MPQHANTMASHLRDFAKMNPPMFYGSRSDEDPQDFFNDFYKILYAMDVTSIEKDDLEAYKLKDVAQTWYVQWRDNRALRRIPMTWDIFKKDFLDRFFLRELK